MKPSSVTFSASENFSGSAPSTATGLKNSPSCALQSTGTTGSLARSFVVHKLLQLDCRNPARPVTMQRATSQTGFPASSAHLSELRGTPCSAVARALQQTHGQCCFFAKPASVMLHGACSAQRRFVPAAPGRAFACFLEQNFRFRTLFLCKFKVFHYMYKQQTLIKSS